MHFSEHITKPVRQGEIDPKEFSIVDRFESQRRVTYDKALETAWDRGGDRLCVWWSDVGGIGDFSGVLVAY